MTASVVALAVALTLGQSAVRTGTQVVGNGTKVQATGSTTARSLAARFADVVNVKDFGAAGDGVADDTAEIQAAITVAVGLGKRLHIPAGVYAVTASTATEVFRINGPLFIVGDGMQSTLIMVGAGVGAAVDVFRFVADTAGGFKHLGISGLGVVPASGTPANYAICIDTTTGPIADVTIDHVYTEQLGGGSIRTINPSLSDGFFTSTIRENFFVGGILFQRAGDSIRIQNNTISGNGIGIDWDAVAGSNVGAITNNNITTKDSAIRLRQSYRTIIRDNNLEPFSGGGYSGNPVINVTGSVATVYEPRIEGNTVLASLVPNTDAISFADALNPVVGPNTLYTAGTGAAVRTTAATVGLKFDRFGSAFAVGPSEIVDVSAQARVRRYVPLNGANVSADRGDTSQTLTVGTDYGVQRWATTLTANRTVTLSTTGAVNGDTFRIVRTGLGAFTLDVGGLKTIPSATAAYVDVAYNGSAWVLTGYGAL